MQIELFIKHSSTSSAKQSTTRLRFSQKQTTHECIYSYAHMTLTLTTWPWYLTLTYVFWRRICVQNTNFVGQGVQKLTHDDCLRWSHATLHDIQCWRSTWHPLSGRFQFTLRVSAQQTVCCIDAESECGHLSQRGVRSCIAHIFIFIDLLSIQSDAKIQGHHPPTKPHLHASFNCQCFVILQHAQE